MEFLGSLERRRDFLILQNTASRRRSEKKQRQESTRKLKSEIAALRKVTGYTV
jgi:hypothetical protein